MRGEGHLAGLGKRRGVYRVLMRIPEGKRSLRNPGVDERIILKWTLRKWDGVAWTVLIWLRIGTGVGTCA